MSSEINMKYYQIDNAHHMKFSLEHISDTFYELIVFEDDKFAGSYCFKGDNAKAEALEEMLSYCEIDAEDFNAEEGE